MSMLETLLDPKRRQKAAEDQERLKAVMSHRVARQPAQANYLYGVAREALALEQLDQLGTVTDADQNNLTAIFAQLAEGLALQGIFDQAARVAPEGARKEMYLDKAKAVANVGVQQCEDPPTRTLDGKEEATQLAAGKVWTGKVIIQFTRCLICGAVSAYA